MPLRTFVDADILIAAHRGRIFERDLALALLEDSNRNFIASPFLWLEVMSPAIYHKSTLEMRFYRAYFEDLHLWVSDLTSVVQIATEQSEKIGIKAMDSLHIAAAHVGQADEFYTLERTTSRMYQTSLVNVRRLNGV